MFFCATTAFVAFCAYYVRTHPLIFNESFWTHAHCIKGGGLSLVGYAGWAIEILWGAPK